MLFHLALLAVLIGMALTTLLGFKATALVVVGNGFANTVTQYDSYTAGGLVSTSRLVPFSLTVDAFTVRFETGRSSSAQRASSTPTVAPSPRRRVARPSRNTCWSTTRCTSAGRRST